MRLLIVAASLLAACCATARADNTVYKWKDANGVTQYSGRPPAGQKFETRRITQSGATVAAEPEQAAAGPNPCGDARRNLELLSGSGPVMQDTDGDGKGDTALAGDERQAQKDLAAAAVRAYCKDQG